RCYGPVRILHHRPAPLPPVPFFSPERRPPPPSPLFPYTTLFRSTVAADAVRHPRTHAWPAGDRCAGVHDGVGGVVNTGTSISGRSEEHTSELQSLTNLVCRLLLEKKKKNCALSSS